MMPELYLADALGAAGKPMMRVHTAGSVGGSTAIVAAHLVAGGRARAGADGRLREAVRERRDVGALAEVPLPAAARRGRGRLLRAARSARYIRRSGAPDRRGHARRGEGPPERAEEPVRAPAHARHLARDGDGVADALGPDPLPRDVPVLGRRVRDGARERGRREARAPSRRPGSAAPPCAASRRTFAGPRPGRARARGATAPPTSTARPASPTRAREIDVAEIYVPFSLVRADVAREPRLRGRRARAGS